MSPPFYQVILGQFVIVGKEPDGDSVRFIAKRRNAYRGLSRDDRIKPSRQDGSVQLRFEGVDAPELHYGKAAQPLGKASRDRLLDWIGFKAIEFAGKNSNLVREAQPEAIPGAILTQAVEINGRPVSYVLLAADADSLKDGDWVQVNESLLLQTLNFRLLAEGMAYYTVYTSTPLEHRQLLRQPAAKAREKSRGVWELDTTDSFTLKSQDDLGPNGQLILPKLFRRCTDYLKDTSLEGQDEEDIFRDTLRNWLLSNPSQNDRVLLLDSIETLPSVEVQLSDLLRQSNKRIFFQPELLDVVFVEK